jgi:hypothetical protein
MGKIICPDCVGYEHCLQMGYADAEKCVNFERKTEFVFIKNNDKYAVGKIDTRDLMANTLQFDKCERVIFRDRTLDFQFEIGHDQYKNIDTIIVNGIKFKKV